MRNKVAIIGAGRGGTAFLHMLSDYPDLEIVGIADTDMEAPGVQLARQRGIPVFQNLLNFLDMEDLDLLINLTGSLSVDNLINESMSKMRTKNEKVGKKRTKRLEVLGGMGAKLFWEIVNRAKKREDEKAKLAENMLKLNKDLNDVKEYVENILENSPDMIITTDKDKNIVSFNKGSEDQLGYSRSEVFGKTVNFLWKNKEERENLLNQLENLGNVKNYETELVRKDNSTVQVDLTLSHLKNQAGDVIGTVGISKDISEKKKMEKELLRSNEELENFVYTISHDLQAPLRGIHGFSELLIEEYDKSLGEQGAHYLERIKKGTERMKLLIDDLLELSRIGHQEQSLGEVDILEMLSTVKEFFHFDLKSKNGEIKFAADFPSICCDKTRIQQVFSNLISNAVKFSRDNALVEIGYSEKENSHQFFVKDNGIGIAKDYHEKIFQIFQRLHKPEEYKGTGIGLTIVKKIIELHQGQIWLESEPNIGTTFYFTISKVVK